MPALRTAYVDLLQELRILPEARRRFHHHVILIERRIHGGDLALAKGVVQHVVDQLRRDAEARGRIAIVLNHGLQAAILLIGVDVGDQPESAATPTAWAGRTWSDPGRYRRAW